MTDWLANGRIAFLVIVAIAVISVGATTLLAAAGGTAGLARWAARLESTIANHRSLALLVYVAACFLTQLIVVPSGTLLVLAGGYLFGAPLAAGILAMAAFVDGLVLFAAGRTALSPMAARAFARYPRAARLTGALRSEGFTTVALLRLAPVVPSAVAALAASAAGVPWSTFVTASALTIWVRPLLVAIIGAQLHSLVDIAHGLDASVLRPIAFIALACAVLLAIRVALRLRRRDR